MLYHILHDFTRTYTLNVVVIQQRIESQTHVSPCTPRLNTERDTERANVQPSQNDTWHIYIYTYMAREKDVHRRTLYKNDQINVSINPYQSTCTYRRELMVVRATHGHETQ